MNPSALHLYLVADPDHAGGDLLTSVQQALLGGVTLVQLRAKSLTDREHCVLATALREICALHDVPFIVNDRLDIALASGADGVHLGVHDLRIDAVRNVAGPEFIIGFSPETDEQIAVADQEGADYLGIGPVFGTATKVNAGDALGLDEFARRCRLTTLPVVGIGGIGPDNARAVITAGAVGVAVVSAILTSLDPLASARALRAQSTMTVR